MGYSEDEITTQITTLLRNIWSTVDWGTAALATAISEGITKGLREIALYRPYIGMATVTTSAGTKSVDISGTALGSLLYGENEESFEAVEFQVDKDPPRFREFKIHGSKLFMDISFMPDNNEEVRLYIKRPHVLDGTTTNTLDPILEPLLVDLIAARTSLDKSSSFISTIAIGGNSFAENRAWAQDKLALTLSTLRTLKRPSITEEWPKVV